VLSLRSESKRYPLFNPELNTTQGRQALVSGAAKVRYQIWQ